MGEESKRGEKSSNPDTFSTGQSVYCVPAAFCIYSVKFKYPPFSRCFPCVPPPQLLSDELEMLDSGREERGQRQLPLHFQPLSLLRNSRQEQPGVSVTPYRQSDERRQKHCHRGRDLFLPKWVSLVSKHFLFLKRLILS